MSKTNIGGIKVKCGACGSIIQSMHRHDFKYCNCRSISVDGGNEYLKISCKDGVFFEIINTEEE